MNYNRRRAADPLEDASELLFVVESEWPKLSAAKNFNPLETVLPLLDNTSVGLANRYDNFIQLQDKISNTLAQCIENNRKQFVDHLDYYADVSDTFKDSHQLVEQISIELSKTNDSIISENKTYLKDLNQNSIVYGKLIDTVEAIEFVKTATQELNGLIGDKNFIKSQELILNCSQLAKEFHLWRSPALHSIKNQLETQESLLFEVVIEEIHSIIYLKHTANKTLQSYNETSFLLDTSSQVDMIHKPFMEFLSTLLDEDAGDDDTLVLQTLVLDDDDHFNKLKNLLLILHNMGKLDKLLTILITRQATELHQLFSKIIEDIKAKASSSSAISSAVSQNYWQDTVTTPGVDSMSFAEFGLPPAESIKLQDLFNSISTRSLIILQYHRIIYEISLKLGFDYSIEKIFEFMESSLLSIVSQYIVDEDIVFSRHKKDYKTGSSSKKLKKTKLFEFKPLKENDEMTKLTSQIQDFFFPTFNIDDKIYLESKEINANLETIVEPTVLNIRVILNALLLFVEGSKKLIPLSKKEQFKENGGDMEPLFVQFMRTEYLKNFDQTLQYYYETLCTPKDDYSFEMVIKTGAMFQNCCLNFQKFLYSTLEMLNTSLCYKEEYVNSIFNLLVNLNNRFGSYYQEISDEDDFVSLLLREGGDQLKALSMKAIKGKKEQDLKIEIDAVLKKSQEFNNNNNEILKNDEFFWEKVSQLLHCLEWLLEWMPNLVRIDSSKSGTTASGTAANRDKTTTSRTEALKQDWELIDINYSHSTSVLATQKRIYLTLNEKMANRFDNKLISTFQQLKQNVMLILRYSMIYQSIHAVMRFFNNNEFYLTNEINEPDQNIIKLTNSLLIMNKILSKNLGINQMHDIITGLSFFLDHLFIIGSFKIKRLNENGLKKIFLNILILQQLLRNLFKFDDEAVEFSKSLSYFENFKINDKGLIDQIINKKGKNNFTFEENKNMIRLIYSEDMKNIKRYNDSIAKLSSFYQTQAQAQNNHNTQQTAV